jgi:hypothetical protein
VLTFSDPWVHTQFLLGCVLPFSNTCVHTQFLLGCVLPFSNTWVHTQLLWKNNDVQSTTKKNKDRATHNPIKTVYELMCYWKATHNPIKTVHELMCYWKATHNPIKTVTEQYMDYISFQCCHRQVYYTGAEF